MKRKVKKALIFDSGAIITLTLNNLLGILEPLKKAFGGEFYLTSYGKYEVIDRSLKIERFQLEALMIDSLLKKGVFHLVTDYGLGKETARLLELANRTFKAGGEWIRIIHEGEASCLALYNLLEAEQKAVVMDERTTRMLCEAPENLRKLLESKLHTPVEAEQANYELFRPFKIIRTSELAWIAFKLGLIALPASPKRALAALLYGLKYKGCAISREEIEKALTIR